MFSCLSFVQLSKQNKIEQRIYCFSSQFSGGLIGFAWTLCCHGDAGVGGGRMWGSQSPHEVDQSHDQGGGGMAAPLNTYSEQFYIGISVRDSSIYQLNNFFQS